MERVQIGQHVLYRGKAEDVLPTIADGSIDAVVTDPPYNIAVGAAFVRLSTRMVDDGDESANVGDTWGWVACLDCLRRGGNVAAFHKRGDQLPAPIVPWHRFYLVKAAPPPTPRPCFVSAVEECSIGTVGGERRRWFGGGYSPNYWLGLTPNRLNQSSGHPFEKPLDAIVTLVSCLSGAGETVLDPFLGSGTTAVACEQTGRRCIGIELDRRYFDIACKRVEAAVNSTPLFSEPVPTQAALFAEAD